MPIYPYNTKSGDKRYRVTYRDPDHSQRTKRGFRRRKDAQDYLARMTTYISDNDYIDPNAGKTLVCQFADTWLKGKKNVVKPKYYADLECSWRVHVCNAWGNREIASIRHSEIQTWVSELAKSDQRQSPFAPTECSKECWILPFETAVYDAIRQTDANSQGNNGRNALTSRPHRLLTLPMQRVLTKPLF